MPIFGVSKLSIFNIISLNEKKLFASWFRFIFNTIYTFISLTYRFRGIWVNKSGPCSSQSLSYSTSQTTGKLSEPNSLQTGLQGKEDDFQTTMLLFSLLRNKRDNIASDKKCAIYTVASDKALRDIANKKPFTLNQLKDYEGNYLLIFVLILV